jgi:hypothetical protein
MAPDPYHRTRLLMFAATVGGTLAVLVLALAR